MCTAIRRTTTSGAVVHARTMDFADEAPCDVIVVPRSYALMSLAPEAEPGMTWTATYAAVGVNTHGLPLLIDGLNEKGLAVSALYHPDHAKYQTVGAGDASRTLAPVDVAMWLLTRFASVETAAEGLRDVRVAASVFPPWGFVPPLHYVLHDAERRCVVVEFIDHELTMHDNPLGVMTNAPEFEWHIRNLRRYVTLAASDVPKLAVGGMRRVPSGAGAATLGLPGDFTSSSRFVRAVALSRTAAPVDTPEDAVQQAFHILANCQIPRGALRSVRGERVSYDYTHYTSAVDTAGRRFYFHTHGNRRVRMVDLMKMNLDATELTVFPMDRHEDVQELIGR
jgi:choloylglycine hydrolase